MLCRRFSCIILFGYHSLTGLEVLFFTHECKIFIADACFTVQECDATWIHSSNKARLKNIHSNKEKTYKIFTQKILALGPS